MYGCWGKYVFIFIFERIIYTAPITIGAQLSIPLAIIISSFLNEKISYKKMDFNFHIIFRNYIDCI